MQFALETAVWFYSFSTSAGDNTETSTVLSIESSASFSVADLTDKKFKGMIGLRLTPRKHSRCR